MGLRKGNYFAHRNGSAQPRGTSRAQPRKTSYPGNSPGGAVRGRSLGCLAGFGLCALRKWVRARVASGRPGIPGVPEVRLGSAEVGSRRGC